MKEHLVVQAHGTTDSAVGSSAARPGSPGLMLAVATLGFAVNFWAWALLSPLGPMFRDSGALGALSESDVACWWRCRSWSARWAASSSVR